MEIELVNMADREKYAVGPVRLFRMDDEGVLHELTAEEAEEERQACAHAASERRGFKVTSVDPAAGVVTVKVAA